MRGWALGLAIATVLAVPIGIVLGSSDFAASAFRVPIEFLRPIPSAALIPLLFLTLGTSCKSEVFLAAFGAFWPLLVQTMYGVRDVDPVAIDTARSFGVGRFERLYRITLPSAVPYIATGLRIASTVALILAFTAELFMGIPGLGQKLNYAQSFGLNDAALRARARDRLPRRRDPLALGGARAARAALASLPAGGDGVSARDLPGAEDRRRDRRAGRDPRGLAALDGARGLAVLPAALDDPRRVPGPLALLAVRHARRAEPRADRARLRDRGRRSASRSAIPLGLSRWARPLAMPHIEYWRAMPPPALLPISIVLLHSIGNRQKVAFIAFFCLFPVLLNTIDGVRGIEPTLIETARSYGIPRRERIRRHRAARGAAADRRPGCGRASRSP